jgi:hypothetical protein
MDDKSVVDIDEERQLLLSGCSLNFDSLQFSRMLHIILELRTIGHCSIVNSLRIEKGILISSLNLKR